MSSPPAQNGRSLGILAVAAAVLCHVPIAPLSAAPVISVRARTMLEMEPIRRTDRGISVLGRLVEPATREPVPAAEIQVSLDQAILIVSTDASGRFRADLDVGDGVHDLKVGFEGDREWGGTRHTVLDLDIAKEPLILSLRTPEQVESSAEEFEVIVKSNTELDPVGVPIMIVGGSLDGDVKELGRIQTDATGRGELVVKTSVFDQPGQKRIEAYFEGDASFDQASSWTTFVLVSRSEISFGLDEVDIPFQSEVRGVGRLFDEEGRAVADAPISLTTGDKVLAQALTDSDGAFALSVAASELGSGKQLVHAVFESDQPLLSGTLSVCTEVVISEGRAVPMTYTLAAFGATFAAIIAFVGLRTQPWRKIRKHLEAEDDDTEFLTTPPTGLLKSRSRLMARVRRPVDQRFSGQLRDAVTEESVAGAHIQVWTAGAPGRDATSDDEGGFDFGELESSTWDVVVTARGYVTERFTITTPHRGELAEARIALMPVRERIFAMYRQTAEPLLPDPDLWGIWTPRQIFKHVREERPAKALLVLTDYVEEAYFSQRLLEESALTEADRHAEAARREFPHSMAKTDPFEHRS